MKTSINLNENGLQPFHISEIKIENVKKITSISEIYASNVKHRNNSLTECVILTSKSRFQLWAIYLKYFIKIYVSTFSALFF